MLSQGRDCVHQSCAAVPSAFLAVVRPWSCSYSRALVVPYVDLLAVLRLLFFGDWVSYLWARLLPAFSVGRVSSPPGEGAVQVLVVLLYFVLLLERFLLSCWGLLSLLGARLWFYLVIVDFLMVSVFRPFLRHLPSCGVPARGRDLRHVALTFAASRFPLGRFLRRFSDLSRSRSRRLLRGGAPRDPQQVSSPEGRWKRGEWCAGVCGLFVVGTFRPSGLGGAAFCRALPRDSDALELDAREKGPHAPQHTH